MSNCELNLNKCCLTMKNTKKRLSRETMGKVSFLIATFILSLTSICAGAKPVVEASLPALASGGKPAYSIVVGRDASDSELLAVAELSQYLGTVTGTTTAIGDAICTCTVPGHPYEERPIMTVVSRPPAL